MKIRISPQIKADHPLVRSLIRASSTSTSPGIEVHVKAAWKRNAVLEFTTVAPLGTDTRAWEPHVEDETTVGWFRRSGNRRVQRAAFSGRAYSSIPPIARVDPQTRYLVTIKMPANPDALPPHTYPYIRKDHRALSMPSYEIQSWQDDLVAVAAHELFHVRQFQNHWSCSEVDAEREARAALVRFRLLPHTQTQEMTLT